MQEILKIVRGAVAEKDLFPTITHFFFSGDRVQGTDSRLTIDAALAYPGLSDVSVPADKFARAVEACGGEPKIKVNKSKISVSRAGFRAQLPYTDGKDFPVISAPEAVAMGSIDARPLSTLKRYVSKDASRPWSCGVYLRDGYAYATNNVVMARVPVDYTGEPVVIPIFTVDELLRLGEESYSIVPGGDNARYFIPQSCPEKWWLHTRLFVDEWPWDTLQKLFPIGNIPEVDSRGILGEVLRIRQFVPDKNNPIIRFGEEGIYTLEGDTEALSNVITLPESGWRADMLELVLPGMTHANFDNYPDAVPFKSEHGVEGVMIGVRL